MVNLSQAGKQCLSHLILNAFLNTDSLYQHTQHGMGRMSLGGFLKLTQGVEKEGAFYLFTLRLIPVFPFWLINLAMGLTKMSLFKFYWVSQIGMLPGTMVFVNAGKELAKIESVKGILSPGLIISFTLIGIFPITVKKLIALYRSRRQKSAGNY